jgi:hypothetical protein
MSEVLIPTAKRPPEMVTNPATAGPYVSRPMDGTCLWPKVLFYRHLYGPHFEVRIGFTEIFEITNNHDN